MRRLPDQWATFFRSSTWRLALLYMVIFLFSVSLLLTFIYWSTAGYMARQADETIETEIQGLAEQYRQRGLEGLTEVMRARVARNPDGQSIYLFATADQRALAGNLSHWPEGRIDSEDWMTFQLRGRSHEDARKRPGDTRLGRARVIPLPGGLQLLVGRDIGELEQVRSLVESAIWWGLALTAALAALGGLAMSWTTSKRIESINQTSREIMAGDLGRRVPTRGSGDDFDQLAENLNAMLDRIQELMISVREVSDNIAHDLKTPLARLRNRLETLQADEARKAVSDAEPAADSVGGALAEADRLLTMFDAVLRIARVESGAQRVRRETVSLPRILADVFELYEPLAHDKDIAFVFDCPPTLDVRGDADLLFQAASNLIDNAVKYTPAGGKVVIAAGGEARDLTPVKDPVRGLASLVGKGRGELEADAASFSSVTWFSVSDTGAGIDSEHRERVFRRFYRLEQSRSTPGNGLGLSLVRAVAVMHQGDVRLEDNQPHGLRVVVELPSANPMAVAASK